MKINTSRAFIIVVILGIVGGIFGFRLKREAFPAASINFSVPKHEILARAKAKLQQFGFYREGMLSSVKLQEDAVTSAYFELHHLTDDLPKLPIWIWHCSFKKESDPESAVIGFSPSGQLQELEVTLSNDKKLPSLDRPAAEALARSFVAKELPVSIEGWKVTSAEDKAQVNRIDHQFSWKQPDNGYCEVDVTVSGNVVTAFRYSAIAPRPWNAEYREMRSYNSLYTTAATFVMVVLGVCALVVAIRAAPRHSFNFKLAGAFGILCGIAAVAPEFNKLPWWSENYDPSHSYKAFLLMKSAVFVMGGVVMALAVAVLYAAAQPLYRELCPQYMSIKRWFSFEALRKKELVVGIILGIAVAYLAKGYQIGFYLLGRQIGYWCPMSPADFQALSSVVPVVDALSIGVLAALMEEGLYRVVALRLFEKLCRGHFWWANFLQAAAWAFAHSSYPQQPAYTRGIELTVFGMFNGWLLKRFGLIPCLVSHYLFDANWTTEYFQSAPPAVAWTAVLPTAIPLAILIICLIVSAKKGFSEDPVGRADTQEFVLPDLEARTTLGRPASFHPQLLSTKLKAALFLLIPASCAAIALLSVPSIGSSIKHFATSRAEAIERSRRYQMERGATLFGYQPTTRLETLDMYMPGTDNALIYLREKLGYERTVQLVDSLCTELGWDTIWWSATGQCYEDEMDKDGAIYAQDAGNPPGSDDVFVKEPRARTIAETFLNEHCKRLLPVTFVSSSSDARPSYSWYNITFDVPRGKVGDANLRVNVIVSSESVRKVSTEWVVPDSWLEARKRESGLESIMSVVRLLVWIPLGTLVVWLWIGLMREGYVRWKVPLYIGLAAVLVYLAKEINTATRFFMSYDGSSPVANFVLEQCVSRACIALSDGVLFALGSMLVLAIFSKYYKPSYLQSLVDLTLTPLSKQERPVQLKIWIDSVIMAAAIPLAWTSLWALIQKAQSIIGHLGPGTTLLSTVTEANAYLPWFNVLCSAVRQGSLIVLALVVVAALAHRFLKGNWWLTCLVALLVCALLLTDQHYVTDNVLAVANGMVFFGMGATIFLVSRKNLLTGALAILWINLCPPVFVLFNHGLPLLMFDTCLLTGVILAPLFWLAYLQSAGEAGVVVEADS